MFYFTQGTSDRTVLKLVNQACSDLLRSEYEDLNQGLTDEEANERRL